jgi:hypothetical protein
VPEVSRYGQGMNSALTRRRSVCPCSRPDHATMDIRYRGRAKWPMQRMLHRILTVYNGSAEGSRRGCHGQVLLRLTAPSKRLITRVLEGPLKFAVQASFCEHQRRYHVDPQTKSGLDEVNGREIPFPRMLNVNGRRRLRRVRMLDRPGERRENMRLVSSPEAVSFDLGRRAQHPARVLKLW